MICWDTNIHAVAIAAQTEEEKIIFRSNGSRSGEFLTLIHLYKKLCFRGKPFRCAILAFSLIDSEVKQLSLTCLDCQ